MSPRLTFLLESALALLIFGALSCSSLIALELLLILSTVVTAVFDRWTNALLAGLVFGTTYWLLTLVPYDTYHLTYAANQLIRMGSYLPNVHCSVLVPASLLLVVCAWLLASRRLGFMLAVIACCGALSCSLALGVWGSIQQVELNTLGAAIVWLRASFVFLSGCLLVVLLYFEQGTVQRCGKVLRISSLLIAGVCVVTFVLQHLPALSSVTAGSPSSIVVWWPTDAADREEFADTSVGTGLDHIGLFGELPRFLTRWGYRVVRADRLDTSALSNAGTLCLLTPWRPLENEERNCIHEFVSRGGSLLVAAEHTNLGGVQEIYNELLAKYGVAINFDTVTSLLDDTTKGTSTYDHPLGRILSRYPDLQYNRGASLTIELRDSVPVLVGDLWHVDAGDVLNQEGGYLGDQVWSRGDHVGNAVLVAAHGSGRGSVVVFGDTSPFINRNIAHNAEFLQKLFAYLSGESPTEETAAFRPASDFQRCFISTQEANLFSRDGFSPYSVTALTVAIMRLGQMAMVGKWEDAGPNDAIFIINPTRTVLGAEIMSRLENGTTVVVSGAGDNPEFLAFVRQLGYEVGEVPLGTLQGDSLKTNSAWELNSDGVPHDAIVAGSHSVGVIQLVGHGKLVLLCDSGFFYSKNLEDASRRDSQNATFIAALLKR